MTRPERFDAHMSDSDALMWNIEKDPLLRSTIVTVLLLDQAPDWDRLVDKIERGTWMIPRLRQRIATPLLRMGPPQWSGDSHFDLRYHLRRVKACEPTFEAVLDLARTSAMAGFDRARPLWEYTVVEGLEGGRAAMILKVHHSMTDGVGGMKLLLMLFDFERDPEGVGALDRVDEVRIFSALDLVYSALGHNQRRVLGIARRALLESIGVTRAVMNDPVGTVRGALRAAGSVVNFLKPATDPHSPIMQSRTLARQLHTLEVPLDSLKAAAKTVGGSLNDSFVAAVIGGMQRYHEFHGASVDDLRMVMPINLRADGAALGGNHFTPARFLVPLTIKDPGERIVAVGRLTRVVRDEPAVHLSEALAGILNQLPTTITTAVFGAMLKGGDFVTSNVPGAPFPIFSAGAALERMYAFAPLAGTAINVTMLSNCGTCCIGVNVDAVAVPDSETFLRCLEEGFAEVLALA